MNEFSNKVKTIIDDVTNEEQATIKMAAKMIFNAIKVDGVVHVFATGHSHMFAEELFYRAGGLVNVNPILEPCLMQHEGAIRSTKLERLTGLAETIFNSIDRKPNEPFIIVSNSGINAVPVEMANLVRKHGHPLIVVTSKKTSEKLTPRNTLNQHLYELADVVIDNHTPYGDGVIEKPYALVGAVSSIAGAYIAQSLVLEIIKLYEENNLIPPVYHSANTPGGDEYNQKLYDKYQRRIKSLY